MTVNVIYRNLFSHLSDALCGRAGAALRWALLFGGDVQSVSGRRDQKRSGGQEGWVDGAESLWFPVCRWFWRKAAEKSPSCPHSETDFIYSAPSSCVLLVVSRRWVTIADPDLLLCECVCVCCSSAVWNAVTMRRAQRWPFPYCLLFFVLVSRRLPSAKASQPLSRVSVIPVSLIELPFNVITARNN